MADKLLIVHGYSDGSTSFTALADFFIAAGAYRKQDVFFADYSSMDDEATFRDFADKLNDDFEKISPDFASIDVACHSTGALVTRAWLALHYLRNRIHGMNRPCPVQHLLTWKDVLYEVYVRQEIGAGLEEALRGEFTSDKEVKEAFAKWGVQQTPYLLAYTAAAA